MLPPAEEIQLEELPQPRNGCAILAGYFLLLVMGGSIWAGIYLAVEGGAR